MGQSGSKKSTQTAPTKPTITQPRVPGYWDSKLSSQTSRYTSTTNNTINRPITVPYTENPTVARLLQSSQSWNNDYNRFKKSENEENIHQIKYNQKIAYDFEERCRQIRFDRERRINESYIQAAPTPRPQSIGSILNIFPKLQLQKENDSKYFTIKKRRPELTDDMVKHIQSMKTAPHERLLIEIDGIQILGKDIRTLIGLNWLNDEIINAYMTLLVYRGKKSGFKSVYTFNTFFYPKLRDSRYATVKRWTRKVDIFSYDFLIVPVHLGNHWTLCFIDFKQRTISYYDSLGSYHNPHCDILLDYLRDEMKDKKKQEFSDSGWQCINRTTEGIPQQKNCSDCGVFTCIYAEHLTRQADLDFGQEDMPYYRDRMIYEITKQTILD